MVSIPIVLAVASCGLLLSIGYTASAVGEMKSGQSVSRVADLPTHLVKSDEGQTKGVQAIRGEVLRVDHENCFVKQSDGKEVRLHIDEMTQMTGSIGQGERIEAKVNDQNHALSIREAHKSSAQ